MINFFKADGPSFSSESSDNEEVKWLTVENPTDKDIHYLVETYKLPKDYVTSVLDDQENARFEGLHQDSLEEPALMLMQYPHATLSPSGYMQLNTYPFALILTTDNKLITITNNPSDFIQDILNNPILESEHSVQESLMLRILWSISKEYNKFLKTIIKQTNTLEGELKISTENNQLYQLMDIQKSLVYFESALTENLDVLNRLYRAKIFEHPENHLPHLHDILVEMKQGLTTTKIQLKLVDKVSNTFSAIVSNNLNNVMKILTSLTIVLTIPTIIGGIYGMNVKLPFANREDAFLWIFVVTTAICVFAIYHLKKKNLL